MGTIQICGVFVLAARSTSTTLKITHLPSGETSGSPTRFSFIMSSKVKGCLAWAMAGNVNARAEEKEENGAWDLLGKRMSLAGTGGFLLTPPKTFAILSAAKDLCNGCQVTAREQTHSDGKNITKPQNRITFQRQPLIRRGIQRSGRTAAPYPPTSLSGEGLEGGDTAVTSSGRNLLSFGSRQGVAGCVSAPILKIR